jgi:hypothetical protein
MHYSLLFVAAVAAWGSLVFPMAAGGDPGDEMRSSISFYASFDEEVRADRGAGDPAPSTRFNHETAAGEFVFGTGFDERVFRVAPGKGVDGGGALEATDVLPRNGRIFFPAAGNLAYERGGWGGAVSLWINTDPNRLLKTRFCDPIQITHRGANNGAIWLDFNDAQPRDMRMGAFPAVPAGETGIKEDDPQAPLVVVDQVGFQEGQWHHVVLNWRNFDTGRPDAQATLYVDGKAVGHIGDRAIAMDWDMERVGVYVAVNYIGLLDELTLFNRPLSDDEVAKLHQAPGLVRTLVAPAR